METMTTTTEKIKQFILNIADGILKK